MASSISAWRSTRSLTTSRRPGRNSPTATIRRHSSSSSTLNRHPGVVALAPVQHPARHRGGAVAVPNGIAPGDRGGHSMSPAIDSSVSAATRRCAPTAAEFLLPRASERGERAVHPTARRQEAKPSERTTAFLAVARQSRVRLQQPAHRTVTGERTGLRSRHRDRRAEVVPAHVRRRCRGCARREGCSSAAPGRVGEKSTENLSAPLSLASSTRCACCDSSCEEAYRFHHRSPGVAFGYNRRSDVGRREFAPLPIGIGSSIWLVPAPQGARP